MTTATATSIGSSETSRSGQVRVGFGADDGSTRVTFFRLLPERAITLSDATTEKASLQGIFYGSDETRTRDLRRDRPEFSRKSDLTATSTALFCRHLVSL